MEKVKIVQLDGPIMNLALSKIARYHINRGVPKEGGSISDMIAANPFEFMSYLGKCWQCRFRLGVSGFCTKLNQPVPRYGSCNLFEKVEKNGRH